VCDAIKKSKALKIYVCNVMTQPGETDGYSVSDHIKALERHSFEELLITAFLTLLIYLNY